MFDLEQSIELLSRTPTALRTLLLGLPESWLDANEGPDSWSPRLVLGHLVHGEETDWMSRARMILEQGESRAFDPFDREGMFTKYEGWTLARLFDRFDTLRAANVKTLRAWSLTPDRLASTGTHPDLGQVSLKQLLATWVVHDLSHIAQIARVMAKQYAPEVGPWRAYFPIFTRN
jgi:hypothetical protein